MGRTAYREACSSLKRGAADADLGNMRYVALLIRELFLTVSAARGAAKPR